MDRRQEVDLQAASVVRQWLQLGVHGTSEDASVVHQTPQTCRDPGGMRRPGLSLDSLRTGTKQNLAKYVRDERKRPGLYSLGLCLVLVLALDLVLALALDLVLDLVLVVFSMLNRA